MQHSQHKQSPRPRSKQAQAVATPISKKPVEYAGPSFNHSPAPSNLPPPPFLSKSLPLREVSNFGGRLSPPIGASPLSFLFTAKQKEDSLHHLSDDRPPSLNYEKSFTETPKSATGSERPRGTISEIEAAQLTRRKRDELHERNSASGQPSETSREPQAAAKKSPWATIDKPQAANIAQQQARSGQEDKASAQRAYNEREQDKNARTRAQSAIASEQKTSNLMSTNTKSKRSNNEAPRKRRSKGPSDQSTPKTPISVPRAILKREVARQDSTPTGNTQTDDRSNRSAQPSTFKPLQKKHSAASVSSKSAPSINEASMVSEEEDLRQQAANLMAILQLRPSAQDQTRESRSDTPRGSTPKKKINQTAETSSPTAMESDIRRLLQLGA